MIGRLSYSTRSPERAGRRRWTAVVGVFVTVLVLAGCKLDVGVGVTVNADGTGEVAVTAVVDADVVAQAPGLAGALQLTDATTAGWSVDPPVATEDGGLSVSLRHQFASVEEATVLLGSLGPPFAGITLTHVVTDDDVTVTVAGALTLPGGTFDAFADAELLAAVGGVPFAAQLTAAQATPASAMTVRLTLRLPGEIAETTGDQSDGGVTWTAPLDGSTADVATRSVLGAGGGGGGGSILSTVALVAGIVWLVGGGVLIWRVVQARNRRRLRALHRFR